MSVTVWFEILLWFYWPEEFPGLSKNGALDASVIRENHSKTVQR